MGYALAPLVVLMAFAGLIYQAAGLATSVAGAGSIGLSDSNAAVVAERAITFADACMQTAIANAGLTGASVKVQLPSVIAAPVGANCRIDASASGGRVVYAWAPATPGAIAHVRDESEASEAWFITSVAGVATGVVSGAQHAVPTAIPQWNLLYQAEVRP
ncbi:hypothetical protein [Burkholderia multivorans]|uniref:hypothetical protein n=1 Tax=Burkholderia multivorans TaxID=87883 RepID=UPI000770DAA0|nr:hypothetical protein [Burkholderia multivorans]KVS13914.1 hypothetical protein WK33_11965 [Burkholderia multivorans]MBU9651051.1 hypothetical protein [Burkholderia multivorans]MCA8464006.1 hypothetical protein [Burkholderia multivorans]MCO1451057.1 hypothetical protein [Burkholderia multivorans]MDN8103903.1 hypothetical protein [Burkholderia multivorans]